jgi:flagellar biosynthesis anti-sigma factor FlgM
MKIDKDKQLQLLQNLTGPSSSKAKSDASQTAAQGAAGTTADKVELSGWKDQVASLKEKIKALPDVDEDKVASTQQAITSGTYNANGQMVARSILKSQLLDEIF